MGRGDELFPPGEEAEFMSEAMSSTTGDGGRASSARRVRVDGKFFRLGDEKYWVKGVTYGPFLPGPAGVPLPESPQIDADFRQIRSLGANTVRVYHAPPRNILDTALANDIRVLVDVPWSKHRCFLDSRVDRESGRRAVREAARSSRGHAGLFALSVANEIPPDVVRWSGAGRVKTFLEELVDTAKQEDAEALVTFASFPPTEYLHPESVDFYAMNVYLHKREKFRAYLQRLQNQADEKPLLLGEYGIDSIRNGENEQADLVAMHLEEVFRCGLAGTCIFSYTDEWFTGGHLITDWAFGLVGVDRTPKPVFDRVAEVYRGDPLPPLERYPKVSVVVCSYNGSKTLDGALRSLRSSAIPTTRWSSSTTDPRTPRRRSRRATPRCATTTSPTRDCPWPGTSAWTWPPARSSPTPTTTASPTRTGSTSSSPSSSSPTPRAWAARTSCPRTTARWRPASRRAREHPPTS